MSQSERLGNLVFAMETNIDTLTKRLGAVAEQPNIREILEALLPSIEGMKQLKTQMGDFEDRLTTHRPAKVGTNGNQ